MPAFQPWAGPGWAGQKGNLEKSCYGRGEKRVPGLAWPGSGRPERGKQNGSPKSGHPFFPRSASYFLSPGENGIIWKALPKIPNIPFGGTVGPSMGKRTGPQADARIDMTQFPQWCPGLLFISLFSPSLARIVFVLQCLCTGSENALTV